MTRPLICAILVGATACTSHGPPHNGPAGPPPIPIRTLTADPASGKFEGDFEAKLRNAPENRDLRAMVDLRTQVDLASLGRSLRARGLGKTDRRNEVIRALETVAEREQSRIGPLLDRLLDDGSLGYVRPVAIVNRLVVEGRPAGILALADHPVVGRVRPDWMSARRGGQRAVEENARSRPAAGFPSWALDAMGVPLAWDRGFDGTGVIVGAIDTGAYATHEQLRGRMLPEGRGWYDPVQSSREPFDSHDHGTSVLSLAVGGNPNGRLVGVAPGSRWTVALGNWQNHYSRVRMTLAADWMLRVARPDVLVNAWSHNRGACEDFDLPFLDAWKAAQIFVVFPAGNAGPAPRTGEAPAQLAGVYPDGGPVFSVSGLSRDLTAFDESSRGPSACGSHPFPSLAVPGAELPYAFIDGPASYGVGNGTSLAAGLLAGVAALLLEADPELSPSELESILVSTARDLGSPGHDDETGAGIVDVPAALREIEARRTNRTGTGRVESN